MQIADRHAHDLHNNLVKLVPNPARMEAITDWLEGDTTVPLTDNEYTAAMLMRATFDKLGQMGLQRGVIGELIDN